MKKTWSAGVNQHTFGWFGCAEFVCPPYGILYAAGGDALGVVRIAWHRVDHNYGIGVAVRVLLAGMG